MELTKEDLTTLINVLGVANVRLVDAPQLIALSNKLSNMVAELSRPNENTPDKPKR